MQYFVPAVMVLALGACNAKVPDSGAGVGFGSYSSYEQQRAAREAELQRQKPQSGGVVSGETPTSTQTKPANSNNPRISDEQDFDAVSGRESIESDKERLARQKEQYVVIAPTNVPTGGSSQGATLVNYALSTTNRVGESVHKRASGASQSRYAKNCQKYVSSDMAQADFLKNGGPRKDRNGVDPDGDGFACGWDPRPFRNARKAAVSRPAIPAEAR